MRKFNVELNTFKLEQKRLQLSQYENQLKALQAKLSSVSERYTAKKNEVSQLETAILSAQTDTVVSK